MKTVALIPAYNAGKTIEQVVKRIPKDAINQIIIVNDGSKDNTADVLSNLKKEYKNLKILIHEKNMGYGAAQKTLYKESLKTNADYIIILHADKQHYPEEIPSLITPLIEKKADVIMGSRTLMIKKLKDRQGMPLYKYIGSKFLTFLENIKFGTKLSTFHSGYRACTRTVLENTDFDKLTDGYTYDTEFLWEAHKKKYKIGEVPVKTYYGDDLGSHVNVIGYTLKILKLVFLPAKKKR